MGFKWLRVFGCLAASLVLLAMVAGEGSVPAVLAQEGAAGKAPEQPAPQKESPDLTQGGPTIRTQVQLVTTPVTVFDSAGQFVYDLDKNEFKIYDNGEPQTITNFDSEMRRVSLVVVVETNDNTEAFLGDVHPLGPLFSDLLMGPQGEVALLTYSDHVDQVLNFTTNGDKLDTALRGLRGGRGGMHLDDALAHALSMLDKRPKDERRVVVVFSDGFNIGSQMSRGEILKRAMNSDITVYGLGFSPAKGMWSRPQKEPRPDLAKESVAMSMPPGTAGTPGQAEALYDDPIPMAQILLAGGEEVKGLIFKSSLKYFSLYSGGVYYQKWGKDTVQEALNRIATEIHSQYELAYVPNNLTESGFHKIKVEVRRPGAKVRARAGYFYQGPPEESPGQPPSRRVDSSK
jgi:VWFA-related protein